jgi:hypothetical protein
MKKFMIVSKILESGLYEKDHKKDHKQLQVVILHLALI